MKVRKGARIDAPAGPMAKKLASNTNARPGPADGDVPPAGASTGRTTRTTIVLPETLDQNLELFSVRVGLPKGEIIKRVLAEYLKKEGLQPDKRPKSIQVSY
jgi:hypothetical protein